MQRTSMCLCLTVPLSYVSDFQGESDTQNTLFPVTLHLKSTCPFLLLKKENVALTGKGNI